jgi:hypothetical protein
MFQLTMSHLHDDPTKQKHDSDSCVPNIEDGLVALSAFQLYLEQLSNSYGVKFDVEVPLEPNCLLNATAKLSGMHGTSLIEVTLSNPAPQDDPERIVELMRLKAKYTYQITPE